MKQGNPEIRRKQVKQISVSQLGGRSASFLDMFLGVWPLVVQKSFNSGAKGIRKWVQLELGKSKKGRPIDLFGLYILFSHFRPRDALMGIFLLFFH